MANTSSDRFLHQHIQEGLEAEKSRLLQTLVSAEASKHDLYKGQIMGVAKALTILGKTIHDWNLSDGEVA